MATLIGESGPLAGRRFELEGVVLMGRDKAHITLADEEMSRRHASLRVVEGVVTIEDLGSTNGTFVNGTRITEATQVGDGETIRVGRSTFRLELPAPVADEGATRIAERPADIDDLTVQRPRPAVLEPDASPPAPQASPPPAPAPAPASPPPPSPRASPPPPPPPPRASPPPPAPRASPPPPPPPPRASPPPPPPPPPARPPLPRVAPPLAVPAVAAEQPFGAFAPPPPARHRGVASRKLAPTLVSCATILATAGALVVYFAGR